MTDLIKGLLAFDLEPPREDYSPLEFGERLGREMPADRARQLIAECWSSLPGSLAESFLEGFLETAIIDDLPSVLLNCLSSTREVSSVCSIVSFLRNKLRMGSIEIIGYSVDQLGRTSDAEEQNRLAYAIQCAGGHLGSEAERIRELQETKRLTAYARSCLDEASRRSSGWDTEKGPGANGT